MPPKNARNTDLIVVKVAVYMLLMLTEYEGKSNIKQLPRLLWRKDATIALGSPVFSNLLYSSLLLGFVTSLHSFYITGMPRKE